MFQTTQEETVSTATKEKNVQNTTTAQKQQPTMHTSQ
jgi:hypothetical protein